MWLCLHELTDHLKASQTYRAITATTGLVHTWCSQPTAVTTGSPVNRKHTYQLHVRRHVQPQRGNERLLIFLYVFSLIFFCIKRKYKTSEQ